MLAAALGRNAGHRALQDLEQGLLNAFAADVPGDGDVLALLGDLVDLVDIDDAALGRLDVAVGRLDQAQQNVFNVLADVTSLGQGGGVCDGEGHVQNLRQALGQVGLAAAGGPYHQDVRFLQLDPLAALAGGDALIVVVHRHAEGTLRLFLADDVIVQHRLHFGGGGDIVRLNLFGHDQVVGHDFLAERDALVTDIGVRAGDQAAHLVLRFPAEGAARLALQQFIIFGHSFYLLPLLGWGW